MAAGKQHPKSILLPGEPPSSVQREAALDTISLKRHSMHFFRVADTAGLVCPSTEAGG